MRNKAAIAGRRFSALKLFKCGWGPNLTVIRFVGSSLFKADSVREDEAMAEVWKEIVKKRKRTLITFKLK